MSIKLVNEVWRRKTPGHPEQAVLLALADIADDDGRGLNPSQEYLAWKSEYSDRQVRRILQSLTELGVVRITRKGSKLRSTEYALDLEALPLKPVWAPARMSGRVVPPVKMSGQGPQTTQTRRSEPPPATSPDILTGPEITGHPWSKHRTSVVETPDIATADEPSEPSEPWTSPTAKSPTSKPTPDSIYLAERINERWQATKGRLTPAALQRFANTFGAGVLEDAIRELHGFPPEEAVRSPYAYLEAILRDRSAAPVRSLEDEREGRNAATELAAHARVAVEDAAPPSPAEASA